MRTKKTQKILIGLVSVVLFLLGVLLMVYPKLSAIYSAKVQTKIHTEYQEQIQSPSYDLDAIKESAIAYNTRLARGELSVSSSEDVTGNGYWEELSIPGSSIMCYIRIPKIGVELPVYHGIGDDVLRAGCGHMPQSSLPIGGESTHTVLSGHSGLASAPMFSDLPLMEIGDRFYISVLGEEHCYEVVAIPAPVLPTDISTVKIQDGRDLCTLVTCVPFGVNTHRLLVQGERVSDYVPVENENDDSVPDATSERHQDFSIYESEYHRSIQIGLFIIAFFFLVFGGILLAVEKKRKADDSIEE